MKVLKKYIVIIVSLLSLSSCNGESYTPKNGDIIFHTSKSRQSKMISEVTKSELTHVGIVLIKNGKPYVFEAVQPVKLTPLNQWISRGVDSKYIVMRSKKTLTETDLFKMEEYGQSQLGKNYDVKFQWSDDKMYCSELVYKVFESAGITLSKKHTFKDYDLNGEKTKEAIRARYNTSINLNETVVTPVDLRNSTKLKVVFSNY